MPTCSTAVVNSFKPLMVRSVHMNDIFIYYTYLSIYTSIGIKSFKISSKNWQQQQQNIYIYIHIVCVCVRVDRQMCRAVQTRDVHSTFRTEWNPRLGPGLLTITSVHLAVWAGARRRNLWAVERGWIKGDCPFKKSSWQCVSVLLPGAPSAPSPHHAPRQLTTAPTGERDTLENLEPVGDASLCVFYCLLFPGGYWWNNYSHLPLLTLGISTASQAVNNCKYLVSILFLIIYVALKGRPLSPSPFPFRVCFHGKLVSRVGLSASCRWRQWVLSLDWK